MPYSLEEKIKVNEEIDILAKELDLKVGRTYLKGG